MALPFGARRHSPGCAATGHDKHVLHKSSAKVQHCMPGPSQAPARSPRDVSAPSKGMGDGLECWLVTQVPPPHAWLPGILAKLRRGHGEQVRGSTRHSSGGMGLKWHGRMLQDPERAGSRAGVDLRARITRTGRVCEVQVCLSGLFCPGLCAFGLGCVSGAGVAPTSTARAHNL
jgi:hypothetical protein